ncbi:MAG: hypothetical protein MZV63_19725 [Marinilabiliales bacterium]|nr:hypothetical protein [Marinilabiliales bacterium]
MDYKAQTSQATLSQVELMKQMLGSWTAEMGKDTTVTCEYKSFGFGMEDFMVASTKGKIFLTEKGLWGMITSMINLFMCNCLTVLLDLT